MPSLTGTEPRRTIYGFIDRLNLPGLYRTFDFPDPSTTSPRRDQTTVAPQALFLMNHPFTIEVARSMLARPISPSVSDTDALRSTAVSVGLWATPSERGGVHEIRDSLPALDDPGRWQSFAQAILMANEFVFVD